MTALFDGARDLGILHAISDDGCYWETRDIKTLVSNVGDYNMMMAVFADAMRGLAAEAGLGSDSPIEHFDAYEVIKTAGEQRFQALLALLDKTRAQGEAAAA